MCDDVIDDVHVFDEASSALQEWIPTLKMQGVDTLYLEFPTLLFEQMEALSPDKIRELAEDKYIRTEDNTLIHIGSAEDYAAEYGARTSDDVMGSWLEMIAALRENTIRVVNIDKKGQAREVELNMNSPQRISSTDFVWTEAIQVTFPH